MKQQRGIVLHHKKRHGAGQVILAVFLLIITILCALPIELIFASAFADETLLTTQGFMFFPTQLSMDGFNAVLRYGKQLFTSYGVTLLITVTGTVLGLIIMAMYANCLTMSDFPLRRFLIVWAMIPMLFSGGQLSTYIIYTSMYHLRDNLLVLILPLCVSTMNLIILRTYIQTSIPKELMDSARIDGAGEYRTFFQIVLPLMKPSLAAVGFMMATAYWNDWQNALLFITSNNKKPLQLLLINIQKSIETLLSTRNIPSSALAAMQGSIPQYSATMATVVMVIGPIMIVYPFFQKYFIKGMTIGSVKG
ncbi:carbohydrate ABC transporter permease [Oscillospiraceae bacterium HV4-5-C5C]|nr:carbohydrate ABC transporter permease [Oscillospiraceae bacterium HV4-5-C5C]